MKWLIVNADDLGASDAGNKAILDAHRVGLVGSASVRVYAPAFRHALAQLRGCPSLDVGLHLNLSEGDPVVLGHKTLVGPDGRFLGAAESRRRAVAGLFDAAEVERETEAQIATLQDAGLKVTHLDGFHHMHVYGVVPAPAARAAARRGLRYFRCPADKFVFSGGVDIERARRIEELRRAGLEALRDYAAARMKSTEHFGGLALAGRMSAPRLIETLRHVPDGLTELMIHPDELPSLTGGDVRRVLPELDLHLTDFGRM